MSAMCAYSRLHPRVPRARLPASRGQKSRQAIWRLIRIASGGGSKGSQGSSSSMAMADLPAGRSVGSGSFLVRSIEEVAVGGGYGRVWEG